jgi:peroxiredoxin
MFLVPIAESKLRRILPLLGGLCLGAVLFSLLLNIGLRDPLGPIPASSERHRIPDLAFRSLDGQLWTLSAQRGKIVLANLFESSCGPCRLEIPELVKIARRYQHEGVIVVGISDDENAAATVPEFVQHFRIPYPILMCYPHCEVYESTAPLSGSSQMGSAIEVIPATLLIDRSGLLSRVYYGYHGAYQDQLLNRDIQQLLSESWRESDTSHSP